MNCFADWKDICQVDVPLAPFTWYKLGGAARWLLTPRDESELEKVLATCHQQGVPWRVLGRGSNLLIRDEGVGGAVIRLVGRSWESVRWEALTVNAAAGVDFMRLQKQSAEHGLAGLETLAGIPGCVGGVIHMNAGGRHGNIAQFTSKVRVLDANGGISTRSAEEVGFGYRRTNLAGCIVLGATFTLNPEKPEGIETRARAIWNKKRETQPALGQRTAGCIFRNPPGDSAGRLLDSCGLKGACRGQARISRKHANFIIAEQGATAQDVLDLIEHARECVHKSVGIELELEIEIW